jgi:hypothetical protein
MNRHFALSTLAALALTASAGAFIARAAEEPAQSYPPGTLLTVAGNGKIGFSGDGGPATQAAFSRPLDQAVDTAGNLYIADNVNRRVRKVSPDGTITTVAGTGVQGISGDGGPAVKARLWWPGGVAVDPAGDLFVADDSRVRKVSATGIITTVAGTTQGGFSGDGGPATAARLSGSLQLAFDAVGNLFIAEFFNRRIRKVDTAGIITTVAGGGKPADGRGDGGPATAAAFKLAQGVAVDSLGNVYISDWTDGRIRKVSLDGTITTVAGGGQPADGVGDGGSATEARLDGPNYIAVDAGGNLYIAENRGARIRKVSPAGIITTVAGNGQVGHTGDGGLATAAALHSPQSVTVDRAGNLFFTEGPRYLTDGNTEKEGNNLVRKVIGVAVPG